MFFSATAALLKINIHVLSGDNHNPMIVERVNRYLNKCLTIFTNERDDVRSALEGILMSLYAWNSAPVIGTDISRSLLVVGREFNFPLDFSTEQHQILTSSKLKVTSFAAEQARLLECGREIAKELIAYHRSWHREYINSRRPDPKLYSVGDKVFARRAVKSNAQRGLVGKLMEPYTVPWIIHRKRKGSSYDIEHVESKKIGKRHAAHLSPFPDQLLPFLPVDGPDNVYGQLNSPIKKSPYENAGLKGFLPHQPHKSVACPTLPVQDEDLHFPTLAELNAECLEWGEDEMDLVLADESLCVETEVFAVTRSQTAASKRAAESERAPPPPEQAPPAPRIPEIGPLTASIMQSRDRLFLYPIAYLGVLCLSGL